MKYTTFNNEHQILKILKTEETKSTLPLKTKARATLTVFSCCRTAFTEHSKSYHMSLATLENIFFCLKIGIMHGFYGDGSILLMGTVVYFQRFEIC